MYETIEVNLVTKTSPEQTPFMASKQESAVSLVHASMWFFTQVLPSKLSVFFLSPIIEREDTSGF